MKKMQKITAILAAIGIMLPVAGCKKSYVDQMASLEKEACACEKGNCADKIFKKYLGIVEDYRKTKTKLTKEDEQKLTKSNYNTIRCLLNSNLSPQQYQEEMKKMTEKYR